MPARSAAACLLLGLALALVAGCSSGDDAATPPTLTVPTTAPRPTTAPPTTVAPTTAAPTGPTLFFPDRTAAIDHLVNAWKFANRDIAAQGADRTAVDNLFTQAAAGFSLYGCDEGGFDTSTCNYRNRDTNGYAQITAEKQAKGWIVTVVVMSTDG